MTPCRCGCGELVAGTWKRGHARRGEGGAVMQPVMPLSAEEIDGPGDVEDLGEIPCPEGDGQRPPGAGAPPSAGQAPAPSPADDDGAGHARQGWGKPHPVRVGPTQSGRARGVRVTVSIRADI